MLIEPLNAEDVPGDLIGHTVQAKLMIDVVRHDNLFLQYDLYHGAMNGEDLLAAIEENLYRIRHMQMAGATGRPSPRTETSITERCSRPSTGSATAAGSVVNAGPGSAPWRAWAGPRLTGSVRGLYRSSQALTSWRCSPRPSTPKRMTSPGLRKIGGSWPRPTPGGVPVAMTSPGNRVI